MNPMSRLAGLVVCAAVLGLAGSGALAQSYPSRPIRLIVPFPPGGPTDVLSRIIGQKLNEAWGQPVVVDNRPGASGIIGTDLTAKAPPDGYTLTLIASTHPINASLFPKLPYDTLKDFTPVIEVASYPLVLVVHPSVPVRSVKELIALAKSKPGQLNYASASNGTPTHLTAELFKIVAGIDMVHIPYKGAAPATTDLVGGQVSVMFNNPVSALPQVRAGTLRALAVTSAKRSPVMPDLPTIAESGFPGFEASTWYGVLGPAGLPRVIVGKLNAEIARILRMPDVRERLASLATDPIGNTPEEFAAMLKADVEKWARVVKSAGIHPD